MVTLKGTNKRMHCLNNLSMLSNRIFKEPNEEINKRRKGKNKISKHQGINV